MKQDLKKTPFSIVPGTNTIDVFGYAGYTLETAIADLIDNSLSAQAKNVWIYVDYLSDDKCICITDDGNGMSLEELKNAAVFGYKSIHELRKADDLGRYSFGLKTATRSFCDAIIVSSKKKGELPHSIQIDYKHISDSNTWEAFEIDEACPSEEKLGGHGTCVTCTKLKIFGPEEDEDEIFTKLERIEKKLSHIFGKFILEKGLNIYIQTPNSLTIPLRIEGWNPFDVPENKTTKIIFQEEKPFKKSTLSIKTYLLPSSSSLSQDDQEYMKGFGLLDQEGFYVYRGGRLIQEGGWLDLPGMSLDEKAKYARIEVEITNQLDNEFNIDFTKSQLTIPSELTKYFASIAKKARYEAAKNLNYMKNPHSKPSVKTKEETVWLVKKGEGGTYLSINQNHPLIAELCSGMSKRQKQKLFSLLMKSVPVKMIQCQETLTECYSKDEINALINDLYTELVNEGKTLPEIKTYMANVEPFKSHIDDLMDFFIKLEGEHHD